MEGEVRSYVRLKCWHEFLEWWLEIPGVAPRHRQRKNVLFMRSHHIVGIEFVEPHTYHRRGLPSRKPFIGNGSCLCIYSRSAPIVLSAPLGLFTCGLTKQGFI